MFKFMIRLLAILLLSPHAVFADEQKQDFCELKSDLSDFDKFKNCNGKTVQFTGKMATQILQHPTGLHYNFDIENKTITEKVQNYVDFGSEQIVVTSDTLIECKNEVQLIGEVDIIQLGGTQGKEDYRTPWLRLISYNCA